MLRVRSPLLCLSLHKLKEAVLLSNGEPCPPLHVALPSAELSNNFFWHGGAGCFGLMTCRRRAAAVEDGKRRIGHRTDAAFGGRTEERKF